MLQLGTTLQNDTAGSWSKDVSFQPPNYRELLAVLKPIVSFKEVLRGKVVQILSENITTVAYINQLGGQNPLMIRLMTMIFAETNA